MVLRKVFLVAYLPEFWRVNEALMLYTRMLIPHREQVSRNGIGYHTITIIFAHSLAFILPMRVNCGVPWLLHVKQGATGTRTERFMRESTGMAECMAEVERHFPLGTATWGNGKRGPCPGPACTTSRRKERGDTSLRRSLLICYRFCVGTLLSSCLEVRQ